MRKAHRIQLVMRKAYLGGDGARRKKYCAEYRQTLALVQTRTHDAFVARLTSKGERISCRKGCTHCCFQHVSATLGHGMAVVDYLYSNDNVMSQFLSSYEQWRGSGESISREIDTWYSSAVNASQPISLMKASIEPLSKRYFGLQIPCPFLVESSCAIYSIRPMCCAAHYSVDEPQWCSPTIPNEPRLYEVMPSRQDIYRLGVLGPPLLSIYQVTLPILIYKLLTEGLSTIVKDFP